MANRNNSRRQKSHAILQGTYAAGNGPIHRYLRWIRWRSPVDWELHERRGQFVYGDAPLTVRYVPGQKAEYNTEVVRAIDEVSARLLD